MKHAKLLEHKSLLTLDVQKTHVATMLGWNTYLTMMVMVSVTLPQAHLTPLKSLFKKVLSTEFWRMTRLTRMSYLETTARSLSSMMGSSVHHLHLPPYLIPALHCHNVYVCTFRCWLYRNTWNWRSDDLWDLSVHISRIRRLWESSWITWFRNWWRSFLFGTVLWQRYWDGFVLLFGFNMQNSLDNYVPWLGMP